MTQYPTVSVLIATLGRDADPIHVVRDLLAQTVVPDEILVVDQNNPSLPKLDEFLAAVPKVRHIKFKTSGLHLNWNRGLHLAKGEVILLVDDDVVLPKTFVEAHLKNYVSPDETGKTAKAVAGRVLQAKDPDPATIKRSGGYSRILGSVIAGFNGQRRQEALFGQGANVSFNRAALIAAGGYDVGFTGNAYFGETDAGFRYVAAGNRMVFDPLAELKHLQTPMGGCRVSDKSMHTYWFIRNGIRLYRRHSPLIAQPLILAKLVGYVAAKALYNRNLKILTLGLKGVADGWRQNVQLNPYDPAKDPEMK